MSKRRFARSGQTDRHAASVVDTDETLVSDDIRGEHVPTLAGIVLAGSRDVTRSTMTPAYAA